MFFSRSSSFLPSTLFHLMGGDSSPISLPSSQPKTLSTEHDWHRPITASKRVRSSAKNRSSSKPSLNGFLFSLNNKVIHFIIAVTAVFNILVIIDEVDQCLKFIRQIDIMDTDMLRHCDADRCKVHDPFDAAFD